MSRMKAMQVSKPGGNFELVERPIPEPGRNQVCVKVEACGICHSDVVVKEGTWPGLQYPRIPGHEIAGSVDAVGADVTNWKPGQLVGVGWHGGHCFVCDPCQRCDFILCRNEKITAISFDGGYAEYMVAPAEALAAIPEGLPADEASPLLCAGVTVYNPLRNSGVVLYCARHRFSTDAMEGTGNVLAVMDAMGHGSVNATRIYTHTNATLIREAIERRNRLSATAAQDVEKLATKVATLQ